MNDTAPGADAPSPWIYACSMGFVAVLMINGVGYALMDTLSMSYIVRTFVPLSAFAFVLPLGSVFAWLASRTWARSVAQ